jgi:hypothetical protein
MTWALLSISVVQNGTVHWLIATRQRPEWWLVTLVATVLGLTVHLAVGIGRPGRMVDTERSAGPTALTLPEGISTITESPEAGSRLESCDPITTLIAQGAGRRRTGKELDISEYQARQLLAERRPDQTEIGPPELVGPTTSSSAAEGSMKNSTEMPHRNGRADG